MSRYTAVSIAALLAVLAVAAGATILLSSTLNVAKSIEVRTRALAGQSGSIGAETSSLGELKKVNEVVKEMLASVTPLAEDLEQIDEQTQSMAGIAAQTEDTAASIGSATAGINHVTAGVVTTAGTINSKSKSIDSTTGDMERIAKKVRGTAKDIDQLAHKINKSAGNLTFGASSLSFPANAVAGAVGDLAKLKERKKK
jgi:methyl-accepting chemotaxis protein